MASGGGQRGVVGLLTSLCRELVVSPGGDGSLVSRLIGDVLIAVADYALDGRALQLGNHLASDFPETVRVLESREPGTMSLADPDIEPGEAQILRTLGYRSLAMLPLEARGEVWALVEIYRAGDDRFTPDELEVAAATIARFARLLDEVLGGSPSG